MKLRKLNPVDNVGHALLKLCSCVSDNPHSFIAMESLGKRAVLTLLWISLPCVICQELPTTNCPEYVVENQNLNCSCLPPDNSGGNPTPSLTWFNETSDMLTTLLSVEDVKRGQNGTQYTCRMVKDEVTTSTVYTLKVAYGPENEDVEILQKDFVTNGLQTLTLTCTAKNTYPAPVYSWYFEPQGPICSRSENGECDIKFQPPEDYDDVLVTCLAKQIFIEGQSVKTGAAVTRLNLQYPPSEAPVIVNHQPHKELLQSGDNLTCIVSGGKPLVDVVIFFCIEPQLNDKPDEKNATAVWSSLTVNTTEAAINNMTCTCKGIWRPQESFYQVETKSTYTIEHKADITSFQLNNTDGNLTVTGSDRSNISLNCETYSRPAITTENISITRKGNDTGLESTTYLVSKWTSVTTATLTAVDCTDMGTYLCTASNGVGPSATKMVVLNVLCPPSKSFQDELLPVVNNTVSFQLAAYPVPQNFTFYYNGSEGFSDQFRPLCVQDLQTPYMVNCSIRLLNVPEDRLGIYRMAVGNELGSVNVSFNVLEKAEEEEEEVIPPSSASTEKANLGWIGGVVAVIVVMIVIVIIVVVMKRRKTCKHSPNAHYPGDKDVDARSNYSPHSSNPPKSSRSKSQAPSIPVCHSSSPPMRNGASSGSTSLSTPGYLKAKPAGQANSETGDGYAEVKDAEVLRYSDPAYASADVVKKVAIPVSGYATVDSDSEPQSSNSQKAPATNHHATEPRGKHQTTINIGPGQGQNTFGKDPLHAMSDDNSGASTPKKFRGPKGDFYTSVERRGDTGNNSGSSSPGLGSRERSGGGGIDNLGLEDDTGENAYELLKRHPTSEPDPTYHHI